MVQSLLVAAWTQLYILAVIDSQDANNINNWKAGSMVGRSLSSRVRQGSDCSEEGESYSQRMDPYLFLTIQIQLWLAVYLVSTGLCCMLRCIARVPACMLSDGSQLSSPDWSTQPASFVCSRTQYLGFEQLHGHIAALCNSVHSCGTVSLIRVFSQALFPVAVKLR